jgi:hypothetical protein
MLDNAIGLVFEASAGSAVTTHTVSVNDTDNGVTTRRLNLGGGQFIDLTISSEETKDKKSGIVSDRYLVRIDQTIPDPVLSNGPAAVASVYQVFVYPRRTDITHGVMGQLHTALRNLLKDGSTQSGSADSDGILARLFSGES